MRIPETDIRRLFRASLWLKGAHSLVEVLSGLALALISHDTIVAIATALTRAELLEDPRDLVANALRQAAEGFTTDAQSFAAWYLFSHGLIKLVLVAAVLANRVWAYPAFMAAMIGFILYQVYRMSFEDLLRTGGDHRPRRRRPGARLARIRLRAPRAPSPRGRSR